MKKPPDGKKNPKQNPQIFPFRVGARLTELCWRPIQNGGFLQFALEGGRKEAIAADFSFGLFCFPGHPTLIHMLCQKHKIFDAVIHSITGTNNNICIFRTKCNSYNIRKGKKVVYKVFTASSKEV
uniref:Uncharacterized protein n=1 Tax=Micrurus spixii TaxID=129469 RepID=A0A2D4MVC2_9SAUR